MRLTLINCRLGLDQAIFTVVAMEVLIKYRINSLLRADQTG